MAAEVQEQSPSLSKVDSAIDDTPGSPSDKKPKHRRTSSTVSGVFNINDLGESPVSSESAHARLTFIRREGRRRAEDRSGDPEAQLVSALP